MPETLQRERSKVGVFQNFQVEKALREVLEIRKGKGTWEDWEKRWPNEVKEKANKEMKIFDLLGWIKR
ncbi:hypothetical protein [Staphylospora marina]|uniref:hypothetical protein n=1 Tax=Staphylospora marina TaxID=2490858 RepID=UPI000F5BD506|nr:hypothetical protein [Staphylospora marina]